MTNALSIVLDDLTIGYNREPVISSISAELPAGGVTVILGGSGCGKSTLLKNILCLNTPISGKAFIGDKNIYELDSKSLSCLKQKIGVLFQDGALLGSLNLFENVALPLREHTKLSKKEIYERVEAKLSLVGLENFMEYYPNELSGGMRKRAGLARAMIMDPAILFCDEPTSGLDPISSAELDDLLLEMKTYFDMTIVIVSHDLASMQKIADYVVVLGEGKSLFIGSKEDLLLTKDAYLRNFLDRTGIKKAGKRITLAPLSPSVMKQKC